MLGRQDEHVRRSLDHTELAHAVENFAIARININDDRTKAVLLPMVDNPFRNTGEHRRTKGIVHVTDEVRMGQLVVNRIAADTAYSRRGITSRRSQANVFKCNVVKLPREFNTDDLFERKLRCYQKNFSFARPQIDKCEFGRLDSKGLDRTPREVLAARLIAECMSRIRRLYVEAADFADFPGIRSMRLVERIDRLTFVVTASKTTEVKVDIIDPEAEERGRAMPSPGVSDAMPPSKHKHAAL